MKLALTLIDSNPNQPRHRFVGIQELADSIKENGLLEPIMVRPQDKRYQIIHGERQFRAAQLAGLTEIEVLVRKATSQEAYELALIENIQREDLNSLEEAAAYRQLQGQGHTQAMIAFLVGKSQSYVAHKLRLLRLPRPLTFYLEEMALTENHIRQVAKLRDIYTPNLLANPLTDDFTPDSKGAQALLIDIRPEEYPRFWPLNPGLTVVKACRVFSDYVLKHNADLRQWEVAAFWWASIATHFKLTVASLALSLRAWEERYVHALVWWQLPLHHSKGAPAKGEEARVYWGCYGDLRHSASLYLERDGEVSLQRLRRVIIEGSNVLPSSYQCLNKEWLDSGWPGGTDEKI